MAAYPHDYQSRYGMLRGLIPEVVDKFMGCGDLAKGFVRALRRVQLFDRNSLCHRRVRARQIHCEAAVPCVVSCVECNTSVLKHRWQARWQPSPSPRSGLRSPVLAAFAWGTLREILMRQKRNLKYYQYFKLRVSLQLQRGGLICRNLWTFSTLFVKLSTKSGEVQL